MTKVEIVEIFSAYPFPEKPAELHTFDLKQIVGDDKYPADFLDLIVKKGHARSFKEETTGSTDIVPVVRPKR